MQRKTLTFCGIYVVVIDQILYLSSLYQLGILNECTQRLCGASDPSGENELRNQKEGLSGDISAEDFQGQLLSDEQKREKMVEDMITMTREWKEQSKIANKIIKKDIDVSYAFIIMFM